MAQVMPVHPLGADAADSPSSPKIIHKIKLQSSHVSMTPSQICDRIFELVDKNQDGEFWSLWSWSHPEPSATPLP